MRTIIYVIVVMLFGMTLSAQEFKRFDESEREGADGVLFIVLKGQKSISGGGIIAGNGRAFMEQAAHDFFCVFTQIAPEDEKRFDRMRIYLHVADTLLNTDCVEFRFRKKDRDYILKNEELFYQFAKSFENMEAYREYVYFAEGHTTGSLDFPFIAFFKIKAGTFLK